MSIDGTNVKILQTLKGHTSDVTTCDFAPNFTLVTGSSDKTVRIWDWVPGSGYTQRSNSPLKGHKYQVTCVRISPQGSMLASASVDGTAVLWNLHSTRKLYTMVQVNGDAIRVCRFAPDSSILVTAGDNGAICIWDLVHRSLIRITSQVCVNKFCRVLYEHEGTTQSLAFTPDSQYLVSACSLEILKVWYVEDLVNTTTDSCTAVCRLDNVHDLGIVCMDISKHIEINENDPLIKYYKLATCGNSDEVKIWTITSKSMLKNKITNTNNVIINLSDVYDGHSSSVTCVRYSNNGMLLVSSSLDKTIRIWATDGECIASLEGHSRYVNCVSVSKDSAIIASGSTGSNDKQIIIWDLTGNLSIDSALFPQFSSVNNGIPENQLMENVENDENDVKLLEKLDDIADGAINSCCFYGNDLLATGSGDKLVKLFNVKDRNGIDELDFSPLEGHTYAVNHVEFSKDGSLLATCSQDGCTTLWNPFTGEKIQSMPNNSLSVKVCRFSPDGNLLITAGDDEIATIFDVNTAKQIATLTGHLDTITSTSFSPDGALIATTSFNSDFRLWQTSTFNCIYIKEDAHDYGVQSCDFSQNLEPIPNGSTGFNYYLLATCGNDSLVKLWRMSTNDANELNVKLWRSLQGHGGNVICVRFSPNIGEIVCSTATDRQARIWSVYSAECLYVLDHDSIVTSCSFTSDCSVLAIGCLDKTLWIWTLPQQLVFQTQVANKIKCRTKAIIDWTTNDVLRWLKDIKMTDIEENVKNTSLTGEKLLTADEADVCAGLELNEEQTERMIKEIRWLRKTELYVEKPVDTDIPYEYLCPITHEIMREPVTCSDGFTYERSAIMEWFMSGKFTSPMTNDVLTSTDYTYNIELRNAIQSFLDGENCNN